MEIVKGLVSVIMSNFNTPEAFLRKAIESVLNQTYDNFEFIIIDDYSTDDSLSVIESYKDERIKIIKNEKNLGLTKSLNTGLRVARGEFVARMDSDDICLRERFEKQVDFLKQNPQVIVCGTAVELIGDWQGKHSNGILFRELPEKESLNIHLLFGNYPNIVHPTAMFNRELLLKYNIEYNENYRLAQDYRMWVSCSSVAECVNIPEVLLQYRVHGGAVSTKDNTVQSNIALQIMREQLTALNVELDGEFEGIHSNFLSQRHSYNLKYKEWITYLISKNESSKIYNQRKFEDILWKKWVEISYFALAKERNPVKIMKIIMNIPLKYQSELLRIRKSRSEKEW